MPKNRFEYIIKCFYCTKALVYKVQNKLNAHHDARKEGWSLGEYIICPDCKKRPKSELSKIRADTYFNSIKRSGWL